MLSLTLEMLGQEYSGTGDTPQEVVENFVNSLPFVFKQATKGTLTFSNGTQSKTQVLGPRQLRRLAMPLTKFMLIKQFQYGLK